MGSKINTIISSAILAGVLSGHSVLAEEHAAENSAEKAPAVDEKVPGKAKVKSKKKGHIKAKADDKHAACGAAHESGKMMGCGGKGAPEATPTLESK